MPALCLVIAAAMQPTAQDRAPSGAMPPVGGAFASPRRVFESSVGLEIDVVGAARPAPSERKDGYVAIEEVVAGDRPGEWVATTPHGAHWFDDRWREVAVTDLGRRYRTVHPVRIDRDGPLMLAAAEGNIERLVLFDRGAREVRRLEVRTSAGPVFGDFDGDAAAETAVVAKNTVQIWSSRGTPGRVIRFDTVVTDIDRIPPADASGKDRLLVYRPVRRSRATQVEVVGATGDVLSHWIEEDPSRYSVVDWGTGPMFVAHLDRALRLRNASGRVIAIRDSGYDVRTRYARAVRLGSGHEVFLLYNRHYGTSALVVFDTQGRRVHREHPGAFSSTLWTIPGRPDAFYVAVGPDIVRYHLRP